jgi:hypothetical protein
MKTKDLIKLLQEEDPSGEIECCVGNADIVAVEQMPAYYDGKLQILSKDEKGRIIGAKYKGSGLKLKIKVMDICDALFSYPDLAVDYSDLSSANAEEFKRVDDEIRDQRNAIMIDLEWSYFKKWIIKKSENMTGQLVDFQTVREFFDKHIDFSSPLLKTAKGSYVDQRLQEWDQTIDLKIVGMEWRLTKR